jgi:alpha-galactosidase
MESISTGGAYKIGGNVVNRGGLIGNLPVEACVEVPCLVDGNGVNPCYTGPLPLQLAAMNMSNINVQLLTIEAARSRKREHIYHAAMMDPHTQAELPLDHIVKMVDELIEAHGNWLPEFR